MKTKLIRFLFSGAAIAAMVFLGACASMQEAKAPVQVGKVEFKGRTIPIFAGTTVRHDVAPKQQLNLTAAQFNSDATANLIVVIDESGRAIEVGVVKSSNPDWAREAAAWVKRWTFHPLNDPAGKPMIYALSLDVPMGGRLVQEWTWNLPPQTPHPPLAQTATPPRNFWTPYR